MKNVLLLVHDDAGQDARFKVALDLTRALGAHLECLDVTMLPVIDDGLGQTLLLQNERAREYSNKVRLEQQLEEATDLNWTWSDVTGPLADSVRRAAALADLIVLNRKLDSFPYPDMREVTTEILFKSGKPVVAVPDQARGFPVSGRAMVAWDGSPRASAALQAAVPLLQLAGSVVILEIDDASVTVKAEEAAAYLATNDIHARVVRDFALTKSTSEVLLVGISVQRADYVVMGAYGRARSSEAIFGGCTRAMLTKSPVPVFLAHGL